MSFLKTNLFWFRCIKLRKSSTNKERNKRSGLSLCLIKVNKRKAKTNFKAMKLNKMQNLSKTILNLNKQTKLNKSKMH